MRGHQGTRVTQPLLFLVEYALAARWRALGVNRVALLGHSLGELTAASVAGVFSFEDGLRLAAERGRLMGQTPPGVMLAVTLAPESLAPYLGPELWLAAENGPRLSVVSGLPAAVQVLEQRLAKDRVSFIRLTSRNAFHSPLMADAAKAFREKVAAVPRSEPAIPWLSNVSGTWIDRAEAQNPMYWANQILSRVRFGRCLAALGDRPHLLPRGGTGRGADRDGSTPGGKKRWRGRRSARKIARRAMTWYSSKRLRDCGGQESIWPGRNFIRTKKHDACRCQPIR